VKDIVYDQRKMAYRNKRNERNEKNKDIVLGQRFILANDWTVHTKLYLKPRFYCGHWGTVATEDGLPSFMVSSCSSRVARVPGGSLHAIYGMLSASTGGLVMIVVLPRFERDMSLTLSCFCHEAGT
jgi:hypothetical protein